jgi:Zn-dependent M28 family amino/carboxypeptidase
VGTLLVLAQYFSRREVELLVEELSSYHRIQGSPYLEDAGKYIRDRLAEWGVDVEVYDLPYSSEAPPTSAPLVGWFVEDGYAEMVKPRRRTVSSLREAWTAVVAHSPPGEFEGKVCYAPTYSHIQSCADSVILTSDWGMGTYVKAVESGARAVLVFRRNAPRGAYPYFGLFPLVPELKYMKIPALTVPRDVAEEILGHVEKGEEVVVKGFVKSGYRDTAYARIIEARFGNGNGEFHLVAHYCHPGATVNDNVSGSVALLAAAKALNTAIRDGELKVDTPMRFVWVPEHHGTARYLRKVLGEGRNILGAVNLDMVGERQCKTGSTLNLVRPPIALLNKLEASLYAKVLEVLPKVGTFSSPAEVPLSRFYVVNYESGSDHDVYVAMGIPAVMLNQWPDRYYHTSADTIDKVSLRMVYSLGIAAVASVLELETARLKPYLHMVYGMDTLRTSGEVLNARCYLYWKVSKLFGVELGIPKVEPPDSGDIVRLSMRGYLTSLYLRYKAGLEVLEKLRRVQDRFRYLSTALTLIGVHLMEGPKSVERLRFEVSGELGYEVPQDVFSELLNLTEVAGYISR